MTQLAEFSSANRTVLENENEKLQSTVSDLKQMLDAMQVERDSLMDNMFQLENDNKNCSNKCQQLKNALSAVMRKLGEGQKSGQVQASIVKDCQSIVDESERRIMASQDNRLSNTNSSIYSEFGSEVHSADVSVDFVAGLEQFASSKKNEFDKRISQLRDFIASSPVRKQQQIVSKNGKVSNADDAGMSAQNSNADVLNLESKQQSIPRNVDLFKKDNSSLLQLGEKLLDDILRLQQSLSQSGYPRSSTPTNSKVGFNFISSAQSTVASNKGGNPHMSFEIAENTFMQSNGNDNVIDSIVVAGQELVSAIRSHQVSLGDSESLNIIESLKKEVEELTEKLNQKQPEVISSAVECNDAKIEKLEYQVHTLKREKDQLSTKCQNLNEQLQFILKDKSDVRQYQSLLRHAHTALKEMPVEDNDIADQEQLLTAEVEELQSQLQSANNQLILTQTRLQSAQQEVVLLKDQIKLSDAQQDRIESLEANANEKEKSLMLLRQSLNTCVEQRDKYKTMLEKAESLVRSLRHTAENSNAQYSTETTERLKEKDRQFALVRDELEQKKVELEEKILDLEIVAEEKLELQQQLQSLQKQISELQSQAQMTSKQSLQSQSLSSFERQNADLQAEVESIKQKLSAIEREKLAAESTNQELVQANNDLSEENDQLLKKQEDLSQQLSDIESTVQMLRSEIQRKESEIGSLQQQLEIYISKSNLYDTSLMNQEEEINLLKSELIRVNEEFNNELLNAQDHIRTLKETIDKASSQAVKYKKALKESRQEIGVIEKTCDEFERQAANLTSQLKLKDDQFEQLKSSLTLLQTEKDDFEDKLSGCFDLLAYVGDQLYISDSVSLLQSDELSMFRKQMVDKFADQKSTLVKFQQLQQQFDALQSQYQDIVSASSSKDQELMLSLEQKSLAMSQLKSDMDTMCDKYSSVISQLEREKAEKLSLSKDLEKKVASIQKLEVSIDSIQHDHDLVRLELAQHQNTALQQSQSLLECLQGFDSASAGNLQQELQMKFTSLIERLSQIESQVHMLKKLQMNKSLNSVVENNTLVSQVQQLTQKERSLKDQCEQLSEELAQSSDKIVLLSSQLRQSKIEKADLQTQLSEQSSQNDILSKRCRKLERQFEQAQIEIDEVVVDLETAHLQEQSHIRSLLNKKVHQLEEQLQSAQSQSSQFKNQLEVVINEKIELSAKGQQLKDRNEIIEQELCQIKSEMNDKEAELKEVLDRCDVIEQEKLKVQTKFDELVHSLQDKSSMVKEVSKQFEQALSEKDRLERDLKDAREYAAQLKLVNAQQSQLMAENDVNIQKLSDLNNQNEWLLNSVCSTVDCQREQLDSRTSVLMAQLADQSKSLSQNQQIIQDLENKMHRMEQIAIENSYDMDCLKQQKDQLLKEKKDLQSETAVVKDNLKLIQHERDQLQNVVQAFERSVQVKSDEIQLLRDECASVNHLLKKVPNQYVEKASLLQNRLDEIFVANSELQAKADTLQVELDDANLRMQQQQELMQSEQLKYEALLGNLKSDLQAKDQLLSNAEKRYDDESRDLRSKLQTQEAQILLIQMQLDEWQKKGELLIEEKDLALQQLEEVQSSQAEAVAALETELSEFQSQQDHLEKMTSELYQVNEELRHEVVSVRNLLAAKEDELLIDKNEKKSLVAELDEIKKSLEIQSAQMKQLKEQSVDQQQLQAKENRIQQLSAEVDQSNSKVSQLSLQLDQLSKQYSKHEDSRKQLKRMVKKVQDELTKKVLEVDQYKEQIANLRQERENLRQQLSSHTKETSLIMRRLNEAAVVLKEDKSHQLRESELVVDDLEFNDISRKSVDQFNRTIQQLQSGILTPAHQQNRGKSRIVPPTPAGQDVDSVVRKYEAKLETLYRLLEKGERALQTGTELVLRRSRSSNNNEPQLKVST
ncbi:hypothetical protein MP228_005566 [Amoeboaphelidium protococcarum]|nr:hypothetical protein MP228_005566 [Amoeboaphelidium protococcarum]